MPTANVPGKVVKRYLKLFRRANHPNTPAPEREACEKRLRSLEGRHPGIREAVALERAKSAAKERARWGAQAAQAAAAAAAAGAGNPYVGAPPGSQSHTPNQPHTPNQSHTPNQPHTPTGAFQATEDFVALMQAWGDDLQASVTSRLMGIAEGAIDLAFDRVLSRAEGIIHQFQRDQRTKDDMQQDINRGTIRWSEAIHSDRDEGSDLVAEHLDAEYLDVFEAEEDEGDSLSITITVPISLIEGAAEDETGQTALVLIEEILLLLQDDDEEAA